MAQLISSTHLDWSITQHLTQNTSKTLHTSLYSAVLDTLYKYNIYGICFAATLLKSLQLQPTFCIFIVLCIQCPALVSHCRIFVLFIALHIVRVASWS